MRLIKCFKMINLDKLLRENIKSLKPYSSARDEFFGDASVFLDANENPYNSPYNRYPDPFQRELKNKIAEIKKVHVENIFLGNGSDEPIDLLIRAFCEPGKDNIISIDPSYGMYKVAADISNVEFRKVLLTNDFKLNAGKLLAEVDEQSKLVFLCSPNNPTGNCLDDSEIIKIIKNFGGLIILDEAYIDFSGKKGFLNVLNKHPNLVILQTFSKAWGLASIRLGMAFADHSIVAVLNKIKYPYNLNVLTQQLALEALNKENEKNEWVEFILSNKSLFIDELTDIRMIQKIYPSDANFFMIQVEEPKMVYEYLVENKIIVRNRSNVALCAGCLRITVGTQEENDMLVKALRKY
jgi:histidinol-phosphate aminotransferase